MLLRIAITRRHAINNGADLHRVRESKVLSCKSAQRYKLYPFQTHHLEIHISPDNDYGYWYLSYFNTYS